MAKGKDIKDKGGRPPLSKKGGAWHVGRFSIDEDRYEQYLIYMMHFGIKKHSEYFRHLLDAAIQHWGDTVKPDFATLKDRYQVAVDELKRVNEARIKNKTGD